MELDPSAVSSMLGSVFLPPQLPHSSSIPSSPFGSNAHLMCSTFESFYKPNSIHGQGSVKSKLDKLKHAKDRVACSFAFPQHSSVATIYKLKPHCFCLAINQAVLGAELATKQESLVHIYSQEIDITNSGLEERLQAMEASGGAGLVAATTSRAGARLTESREANDGKLVFDYLRGTSTLQKPETLVASRVKIRDVVSWDNTLNPWRRLLQWWQVKFSLRTCLYAWEGESEGRSKYKTVLIEFMIHLFCEYAPRFELGLVAKKIANRIAKFQCEFGSRLAKPLVEQFRRVVAMYLDANAPPKVLLTMPTLSVTETKAFHHPHFVQLLAPYTTALSKISPLQTKKKAGPKLTTDKHGQVRAASSSKDIIDSLRASTAPLVALHDAEQWIAKLYTDKLVAKSCSAATCLELMCAYSEWFPKFEADLIAKSRILLYSFALVMVIDSKASAEAPQLTQHPLLPWDANFDYLHLVSATDRELLKDIKATLQTRKKTSKYLPVLQDGEPTENSFAVRFAETSSVCQKKIHDVLENDGKTKRKKEEEFVQKKQEVAELWQKIDMLPPCSCHTEIVMTRKPCQVWTDTGLYVEYEEVPQEVHITCYTCETKPELKRQVFKVKIRPSEWSLPKDENRTDYVQCNAVAFEMVTPLPTFLVLRQALVTYLALNGEVGGPVEGAKVYQWCSTQYAVGLGSKFKPFALSHYAHLQTMDRFESTRSVTLPCPMDCVYSFNSDAKLVLSQRPIEYWRIRFALKLPLGSAFPQAWLEGSQTHNEVMATADNLSTLTPLPELVAFGSLRAAPVLQWRNLIECLEQGSMNFNDESVLLLVLQAISQERPNVHVELETRPLLGEKVLESCGKLLEEISPNWSKCIALRVIVSIALQVQQINSKVNCLALLTRCQSVAHEWIINLVQDKTHTADVETRRRAAVSGFLAAEPTSRFYLFFLTELFECKLLVSQTDKRTRDQAMDVAACTKHALRCQDQVVEALSANGFQKLTEFVQARLSFAAVSIVKWQRGSNNNNSTGLEHWFEGKTSTNMVIHLDVRYGEFLIDGMRTKHLPASVTQNASVREFLDDSLIRAECYVYTNQSSQLCYQLTTAINGFVYCFQPTSDGVLVYRRTKDAGCLELLVPRKLFVDHLPTKLIATCYHWLNEVGTQVKFEPRVEFEGQQRHLYYLSLPQGVLKDANNQRLVPLCSPLFQQVYLDAGMQRLEPDKFRMQIWCNKSHQVTVELVRFGLSFELVTLSDKEGAVLQSRDWPGYRVKKNQALGVLPGFSQCLLLEDYEFPELLARHNVLIVPFGQIVKQNRLVLPNDDNGGEATATTPSYFDFEVDKSRFKELVTQRDSLAYLFLAQLLAATSHPLLPQQATGESGVESALRLLQSARCWSKKWTPAELAILKDIAALCPTRKFYPANLRRMETTKWNSHVCIAPELDQLAIVVQKLLGKQMDPDELWLRQSALGRNRSFLRNDDFENGGQGLVVRSTMPWEVPLHSSKFLLVSRLCAIAHGQCAPKQCSLLNLLPKLPKQPLRNCALVCDSNWVAARECWVSLLKHVLDSTATSEQGLSKLCACACLDALSSAEVSWLECMAFVLANRSKFAKQQKEVQCLPLSFTWSLGADVNDPVVEFSSVFPAAKDMLPRVFDYWQRGKKPFRFVYETLNVHMCLLDDDVTRLRAVWELRKREWTAFVDLDQVFAKLLGSTMLDDWSDKLPTHFKPESQPTVPNTRQVTLKPVVFTNGTGRQKLNQFNEAPSIDSNNVADQLLETCIEGCEGIQKELHGSLDISLTVAAEWKLALERRPTAKFDTRWKTHVIEAKMRKQDCWKEQFPKLDLVGEILELVGVGPRKHPRDVLVTRTCNDEAVAAWEACDYMVRCARFLVTKNLSALERELRELDRAKLPLFEWRQLELEMNVRIRQAQVDIAQSMLGDSQTGNDMFQLNMGEGKTSLILPMLAVALALPGKSICRILVLSALESTNRRDLRHVLGGCLNRRVYSFPFARGEDISAKVLQKELNECLSLGGIILTIPEHVLSFQLNAKSDSKANSELNSVLAWSQIHCRDVLDECDEILHPKFQLVYTLGSSNREKPIRWTVAFCALHAVRASAAALFDEFPNSVELIKHGDMVLGLRLIENEEYAQDNQALWERICALVLSAVLERRVDTCVPIPLPGNDSGDGDENEEENEDEDEGEEYGGNEGTSWIPDYVLGDKFTVRNGLSPEAADTLLVLRGLLAFEVLRFVLSRRWKVHFGNGPKRLAVPYKAKDVPSMRSDFAHQDSAILFTILHYAYNSLTLDEFKTCLALLEKRDDAEWQFSRWTLDAAAVAGLRPSQLPLTLAALNLKDDALVARLHEALGHNAHVSEFYLTFDVFPVHCKSYSNRISASPWNLSPPESPNRVIGFSGSVDSKLIYPTGTNQLLTDASSGMVVLNLLENGAAGAVIHHLSVDFTCEEFFQVLLKTESLVFLDVAALVGANIPNERFARMWLERDQRKHACVFPRDADGAFAVVTRHSSRVELLAHSPFATHLGEAFVFLDQFRTRGVDFKFSPTANGVVTISRNTTRDACCQAAMRMRLLGSGQCVHFLLSPEVGKHVQTRLDVLKFCLKQTQREIRDSTVHWQAQGTGFVRGQQKEPEACDLESMYAQSRTLELVHGSARRAAYRSLLPKQFHEWEKLVGKRLVSLLPSFKRLGGMSMEEEQEREYEVECVVEKSEERQVQRPPKRLAEKPRLSQAAEMLAKGVADLKQCSGRMPLGDCLRHTTAKTMAKKRKLFDHKLFATCDFCTTVSTAARESNDNFVRQVEWVVVTRQQLLVEFTVLSPYEANALLFDFANLKPNANVALFQFAARVRRNQASNLSTDYRLVLPLNSCLTNVADEMFSCWHQLGMFSGQLFLGPVAAGDSDKLQREFSKRRKGQLKRLMQMRWDSVVGNMYVGSDSHRWIS
ncbi:hypothetical protein BASA81_002241 [Batrachochytrium salamandrivorans]|nr:hypothetical protein BASA81_002241 [Batrachochytrium salamandrivorans]